MSSAELTGFDMLDFSVMSQAPNEKPAFAPSRIQFAYFSLILAWAGNILFYFITTNPPLIMLSQAGIQLADFVGYYEAAKLSAAGANLYDFNAQLSMLNQIIAPSHSDIAWAIAYPPTFYWLVTPFSLLSLTDAFTLWKFFSIPVGLAGTYRLLTSQERFGKIDKAVILLCMIANTPALIAVRTGQFTFVLMALASLYVWGLLQKRDLISGLCIGLLAAIKPHFALFLVIPAFTMRRWKLLMAAALPVSILLLGAVVGFGWHTIPDYFHYITEVYTSPHFTGIAPDEQLNLRALVLYRCLHWTQPAVVLGFGTASLIAGLVISLWSWSKALKRPELFGWCMAVTVTLLLVCGPHVHIHDCLILIIAAILTLPGVSCKKMMAEKDWSYRIWCLTFLLYPLISFVTFNLSIFSADLRSLPILAANLVLATTALIHFVNLSSSPTSS